MNILLINPPNCGRSIPEERYGITSLKQIFRGEPLALEELAGNLRQHDVRIVDLKAAPGSLDEAVNSFRPDVVGITGVTCEANTMLELAAKMKTLDNPTVVVGGIHASNDPYFFNRDCIDYIVVGLGKKIFYELITLLNSGIAGAVSIPGVIPTKPGHELSFSPHY
ncbi:MAG: B12-binding domain-containing radical SAM protein, partial [Bacteroidetes bacterium]|nr:B12-binding domain-containing radical SAM protein [Bacteroidota bacterium]